MTEEMRTGGCSCGQIRYECDPQFEFSAFCHCRGCQQSSGAGAAPIFAVVKKNFKIISGATKSYPYVGDSGKKVHRHFCPNCGAPIFTDAEAAPDLYFVRIASIDLTSKVKPSIKPQMHIYCDSAQSWDRPNDPLPKFGKMPS